MSLKPNEGIQLTQPPEAPQNVLWSCCSVRTVDKAYAHEYEYECAH